MSAAALEINGLRFRYRAAAEAVVSIDRFLLGSGEACLLRAGSGRGKSTLLNLVAGLLEPESGVVRVDGIDLFALGPGKRDAFRGSKIGMIFQTLNLLAGFSAAENVMAALMVSGVPRAEHRDRAVETLRRLGIETPDREATALSVGQQQRVAVARAIVTQPVLVLADEPTASLDPENAENALDLIRSACEEAGAALLLTSHDPATARGFERVVSLDSLAPHTAGSH
ncbi:MAG: ATP-binding cassette domain-containing protein [Planctomycetota bacterium]